MLDMTPEMKEKWIDFISSVNASNTWGKEGEPKKFGFYYYIENCDEWNIHFGVYRRLIREVGYRFDKIIINKDAGRVMFLTTIPNDKYETIKKEVFDEWVEEVIEIIEDDDSSDEDTPNADEETPNADAEDDPK